MFGNQMAGIGTSFNRGAILWLYSPRTYGTQVLRPYLYNFTDGMIDKLCNSAPSMRDAMCRRDIIQSPDLAMAIRPEANGIALDTSVFADAWTFLLTTDMAPKYMGGDIAQLASPSRLICSGWCTECPVVEHSINWAQPIINENCILNITHHTFIDFMDRATAIGGCPQSNVKMNNDLIDSTMDMMAMHTDTYLMTPGDVIQNVHMDEGYGSRITTEGTAAVANIKDNTAILPGVLKSPMHHLKSIVSELGSAIDNENSIEHSVRSPMNSTLGIDNDSLANVINTFSNNVPRAVGATFQQVGIDVTRPISIGDLHRMYPDIRIQPQIIARNAQCDVIPQTEISMKVTYSSMVSAAITSIAADCGLCGVDFSYKSWSQSIDMSIDHGMFEVRNAFLLLPNNDPQVAGRQLEAALMRFKFNLEGSLFPVLKAASGDFELHARYDLANETIVDLHYNDYTYSSEGKGYYEASNRLSQLNTPLIGTNEQFISNGAEINRLIAGCAGKSIVNALGNSAFGGINNGSLNLNGGGINYDF